MIAGNNLNFLNFMKTFRVLNTVEDSQMCSFPHEDLPRRLRDLVTSINA